MKILLLILSLLLASESFAGRSYEVIEYTSKRGDELFYVKQSGSAYMYCWVEDDNGYFVFDFSFVGRNSKPYRQPRFDYEVFCE